MHRHAPDYGVIVIAQVDLQGCVILRPVDLKAQVGSDVAQLVRACPCRGFVAAVPLIQLVIIQSRTSELLNAGPSLYPPKAREVEAKAVLRVPDKVNGPSVVVASQRELPSLIVIAAIPAVELRNRSRRYALAEPGEINAPVGGAILQVDYGGLGPRKHLPRLRGSRPF